MEVKEIMIKEIVSLSPDDNAMEALHRLFKREISGLPVIDAAGRLAGMLTEKDLLTYILPSYIQQVGRFIYDKNPHSVKKKFSELRSVKVSQIMRKDVVTATPEVAVCEVARIMLTQRIRRLPIVDKDGKVVGIIARCDILTAMAKETESSCAE